MIDIKKIYEQVVEDMHSGARDYTVAADGNGIHRECYTHGDPQWAKDAVESKSVPIDLDNPLKHVRAKKFVPPPGAPLFAKTPMPNSFKPFSLGAAEVPVDYGKEIRLYGGGLASVQLQTTGEYCEAAIGFQDALQELPDFEQERKEAQARGERAYRDEFPFDPDAAYVVKDQTKYFNRKNREQAVNKKKSVWELNANKAGKRAADEVVRSRNSRLTSGCGMSDEAARLALNGSLDLDSGTLWWYPTTLDLVRMFKLTVKIPTRCFFDIDANDDNPPAADPEFSRELLAEDYASVRTGADIFRDIRDGLHTVLGRPGERGPFPAVKPVRWQRMVKRLGAVKRPPLPQDPPWTFVDDDRKTWEGRTGMAVMRLETMTDRKYNVITVDGIRVIYRRPRSERPITAFFMTPHELASTMRDAADCPDTVSLNLIRRTFLNLEDLKAEASDMFAQKGGTRRYIA